MQNGVFDERLKQKALKPQIEQALILHIDLIFNVPLVADILNIDILLQQSQLLRNVICSSALLRLDRRMLPSASVIF